jgi:hypothetical protein
MRVSKINIASQTPYEGGYGVYTARVMLDFDPDQNNVAWRQAAPTTSIDQETQIRIFPNPAKEMLFVEALTDMEDYSATILIYNTMGQLVTEQQLSQKMEYISLNSLKTGMYFYTIRYSNGYFENGKFMIQQ